MITSIVVPDRINKVSLLTKIYVWSIITEPLLFFVFLRQEVIGVPISLSRALQFLFLVMLALKYISHKKNIFLINPLNKDYQYVTIYVTLILFSSFLGMFWGAYVYNYQYLGNGQDTMYTKILLGNYKRPLLEIFILIYYFYYFFILPRYIIRTKSQYTYLITWMLRVFTFVVAIGIVAVIFTYFDMHIIPRHLADSSWITMGNRFHSITGEPRDAFVYLMFGLSIIYLHSFLSGTSKPNNIIIAIIIICLGWTQSLSGVAGLCFGIFLLFIFSKFSLRRYVAYVFVLIISMLGLYLSFSYIDRFQIYLDMFTYLFNELEKQKLSELTYAQSPDLVPLWLYMMNIINFDIYTTFFGSGIGSASFATNNFLNEIGVNNPRAQINRLIFESGVIGLYVYLMILIRPIRCLISQSSNKNIAVVWISSVLLFGAVLGHRSNVALIYSGLVLAVLSNGLYRVKITSNNS